MSLYALRQFRFFTRETIAQVPTLLQDEDLVVESLSPMNNNNSSNSSNNSNESSGRAEQPLFVADGRGVVHAVDRRLGVRSFRACDVAATGLRITHLYQVPSAKALIVIAEDKTGKQQPVLTIWRVGCYYNASAESSLDNTNAIVIDRIGQPAPGDVAASIADAASSDTRAFSFGNANSSSSSSSSDPVLALSVKLDTVNNPLSGSPVSALGALPSLAQIAVGFASGHVLLLYAGGSGTNNMLRPDKLGQVKQKLIIAASPAVPVVGLFFQLDESASTQSEQHSSGQQQTLQPRMPSTTMSNNAHRDTTASATGTIMGTTFIKRVMGRLVYPTLFVVTTNQVLVTTSTPNTQPTGTTAPSVLENLGCAHGCSFYDPVARQVVVARNDGVYFYTADGRGPCFAFDAPKLAACDYGSYILLVTAVTGAGPSSVSPASPYMARDQPSPSPVTSWDMRTSPVMLTVLDVRNKLAADTLHLPHGLRAMCRAWDAVSLIAADPETPSGLSAVHLEEITLDQKLSVLFRQNNFGLAIKLAEASGCDLSTIASIRRRSGDYLYAKGDYESAMSEYSYTIGYVEPSYVIRKYLDAQRLSGLTNYLQLLHEQSLATSDHTTLLLNCYAQLRDDTKLDNFIRRTDIHFDVDIAIKVCRQAGYARHAADLALRTGLLDTYISVIFEDMADYDAALDLIRACAFSNSQSNSNNININSNSNGLSAAAAMFDANNQHSAASSSSSSSLASRLLIQYGRQLLARRPSDTTQLAIEMCTLTEVKLNPQLLQPIFADNPFQLIVFLENVTQHRWNIELVTNINLQSSSTRNTLNSDEIETCRQTLTTLLELYLLVPFPSTASSLSLEEARGRAARILLNPRVSINRDQALAICRAKDFERGLTIIYERQAVEHDMNIQRQLHQFDGEDDLDALFGTELALADEDNYGDGGSGGIRDAHGSNFVNHEPWLRMVLVDNQDIDGARDILNRFGPQSPVLYTTALSLLLGEATSLLHTDVGREMLLHLLGEIDERRLISPLEMIRRLSKPAGVVTLGMVRPFLKRAIESVEQSTADSAAQVQASRTDVERKRAEIDELQRGCVVFQATKCSLCGMSLDLPTVHFLCRHSYHARCLGSSTATTNTTGMSADDELMLEDSLNSSHINRPHLSCPRCAVDTRVVEEAARARRAMNPATAHAKLLTRLSNAAAVNDGASPAPFIAGDLFRIMAEDLARY